MRNKKLALFLTLAMIISMFPLNAFGTEFSDMPDNWSTKALESAVANGLLKGDNGRIMPNENLTRAQMATIVNRAFGTREKTSIDKFTDVKKDAWYFDEMSKAVQMKTFIGSGDKLYPDNSISREEAFIVLARAFKLSGGNANILDKFTDKNDISDWAREGISSLVAAGYISGSDGRINPKHNITRAEFAQVMYNLLKNYINKEGTYTEDYDGNLMINVPNVTLKGLTVTGDLIIGDGVGDGEVILDDVTVTGRVLVRGGGENSIKIIGNSNIKNIIIARVDGIVRIYAEDGTEVGEVIADGYDDVIIEGNFESVTIVGTDITVTATNATVESASIEGENSKIIIDEKSSVKTINVNANNAEISGKGTVESVTANANNVEVTVPGASVTAGQGTTGVTAGDKPVEPGKTETVPKEETTSSGGGSGSSRVAVSAISVDEDLVLEKVDNSYTITATVFPSNATNKNLTWTTSDESVATVDNGVITAVGPGTATITVTSVADSSKKATVHVVVGDILVPAIFADDPTLGTLQGEIDKAEPGSTIVVAPATYNEQLIINKPLTLLGPNADIAGAAEKRYPEAIIKGTGNGLSQLLEIDAENVEINGFTFDDTRIDNYNNTTGTNTNLIGGIAIVNNRFINTSGTAIYLRDGRNAPGAYSKDIQICNNKIETIISAGTVDYNAGSGIIVMGAEDLRICGNIISNAAYNGIQLARNKNATVTDNIVTDSEQPALQIAQWNEGVHEISGNTFSTKSEEKGAIRLYGFTNNYIPKFNISNNKIENSHYGIQIGYGDAGKSYNDISEANYTLSDNSFNEISENELIIYLNQEPSDDDVAEMNSLFKEVYGEEYSSRAKTNEDPFTYVVNILKVGEGKEFTTIQAAIEAATTGDNIIAVYPGEYGTESIDIIQQEGVNITLEAVGEVELKNQIRISGAGRWNDEETLTIKGFTFDFTDATEAVDIISATKKLLDDTNNYAHNVSIENNVFKGNPEADVVAIRTNGVFGLEIKSSQGIGLHSLGQIQAQSKYFRVIDTTVEGGESGINYYGPADVEITGLTVEGTGYGVRAGQSSGAVNETAKLTISDSNLTALYPVWLRGDAPGTVVITNSTLVHTEDGERIKNDAGVNVLEDPTVYNKGLETYYMTIQEAIDAAVVGENLIKVYPGDHGKDSIDIIQKEGVNITLEAVGEVTLKNQIIIDGEARAAGTESLTIKGFTFDFTDAIGAVDIISTTNANSLSDLAYNYSHNVTIEDNIFNGTFDATVVAIRSQSSYNLKIIGCRGEGLFSLGQITSIPDELEVRDCDVTVSEGGINYTGAGNVTIEALKVVGELYGVRAGANNEVIYSGSKLVISGSDLEAKYPVIIRGAAETVTITDSTLTPIDDGEMINNVANGEVTIIIDGKQMLADGLTYDAASDIYEISNANGLIYANKNLFNINLSNNKYKLGADIDMSDVTDWNSNVSLNTHFELDGGGYKISGLKTTSDALLVPRSTYTVTIKNLTLENCEVNTASEYAAMLVGYADANTVTIDNCHVIGGEVQGTKYAGALIGWSSKNINITSSAVKNTSILGAGSTGGIVGHCAADQSGIANITDVTIEGCTIKGENLEKSGIVVGTANVGKTTITTNSIVNNTVFEIENSDAIYGRFVPSTTGKLTINGTPIP